jgi:hypothetical protein
MEFSLIDKSNYLKGLLIVAKKDNQLTEPEKKIIRSIAFRLGFAKDFYEETLKGLLANKYIVDTPIKFSDKKIAESFLLDGLRLAYSDGMVPEKEIDWLKLTASINEIKDEWFEDKLKKIKGMSNHSLNTELSLFSII